MEVDQSDDTENLFQLLLDDENGTKSSNPSMLLSVPSDLNPNEIIEMGLKDVESAGDEMQNGRIGNNTTQTQAPDDVYERSGIVRSTPPAEWSLRGRGYETYTEEFQSKQHQAPTIETASEVAIPSNDHSPNDYGPNFASANHDQDTEMRNAPQQEDTQVVAHSVLAPDNLPQTQTSNAFDQTTQSPMSSFAQVPVPALMQASSAPHYIIQPSTSSFAQMPAPGPMQTTNALDDTNQPWPSSSFSQAPVPQSMQAYLPNGLSSSIFNQNSTTEQQPTSSQYDLHSQLEEHGIELNNSCMQLPLPEDWACYAHGIYSSERLMNAGGCEINPLRDEPEQHRYSNIPGREVLNAHNYYRNSTMTIQNMIAFGTYNQDAEIQNEPGDLSQQASNVPRHTAQSSASSSAQMPASRPMKRPNVSYRISQPSNSSYHTNQPSTSSFAQMQAPGPMKTPSASHYMVNQPLTSSSTQMPASRPRKRPNVSYRISQPSNSSYHTNQPSTSSFAQMQAPGPMKRPNVSYRISQPSNSSYHTNQPSTSSFAQMQAPGPMKTPSASHYMVNQPSTSSLAQVPVPKPMQVTPHPRVKPYSRIISRARTTPYSRTMLNLEMTQHPRMTPHQGMAQHQEISQNPEATQNPGTMPYSAETPYSRNTPHSRRMPHPEVTQNPGTMLRPETEDFHSRMKEKIANFQNERKEKLKKSGGKRLGGSREYKKDRNGRTSSPSEEHTKETREKNIKLFKKRNEDEDKKLNEEISRLEAMESQLHEIRKQVDSHPSPNEIEYKQKLDDIEAEQNLLEEKKKEWEAEKKKIGFGSIKKKTIDEVIKKINEELKTDKKKWNWPDDFENYINIIKERTDLQNILLPNSSCNLSLMGNMIMVHALDKLYEKEKNRLHNLGKRTEEALKREKKVNYINTLESKCGQATSSRI